MINGSIRNGYDFFNGWDFTGFNQRDLELAIFVYYQNLNPADLITYDNFFTSEIIEESLNESNKLENPSRRLRISSKIYTKI